MSIMTADQVHVGDTIHLAPHDVWRGSHDAHHVQCITADVRVDAVISEWATIIVICWHRGRTCGATVYDRGDSIERAA